MIKEEFHFTISIVNNMLLVMVKEDSYGPLGKAELLLLTSLQIRASLKISELASIDKEKNIIYATWDGEHFVQWFFISVDFLDQLKVT